jgi:hypothetical protein
MKNKRLRRAVSRTRRHLAIATDKRLINSGRRYDPKTTGQPARGGQEDDSQ